MVSYNFEFSLFCRFPFLEQIWGQENNYLRKYKIMSKRHIHIATDVWTKKLHKDLSNIINESDIDKVFVYGKHIKETFNLLSKNKKGKIFNNLDHAYNYLSKILHNNDILMVKGSNATGLNQFSKNFKKGYISAI